MYTHVGINVTDIEQAVQFYTKLFGHEPAKVRDGYAKFLIEDPALNFTLNYRNVVSGNQVNHFGIQVANTDEVLKHKQRLEDEGLITLVEMNTTCCYSVQDKFWVEDPDGNKWEYFYPKLDSETRNEDGGVGTHVCCEPSDSTNTTTTASCGCSNETGRR